MNTFGVINDYHKYGPHELKPVGASLYELMAMFPHVKRWFSLGDNHDVNHCALKAIEQVKMEARLWKNILGEDYRLGNHEGNLWPEESRFIKYGDVLLTHGDYLFWGKERAEKYRATKRAGSNWFKRAFILGSFDHLRKFWPAKLDDEFWVNAWKYCDQYDCKIIICGHKHPTKRIDETRGGIRAIVLPRGVNVVELES